MWVGAGRCQYPLPPRPSDPGKNFALSLPRHLYGMGKIRAGQGGSGWVGSGWCKIAIPNYEGNAYRMEKDQKTSEVHYISFRIEPFIKENECLSQPYLDS